MRTFEFLVERDAKTEFLLGYVPGWPATHTQGADLEEFDRNLKEAIGMLLEDGEPRLESQLVGVPRIPVP